MSTGRSLARQVNDTLGAYVKVHDAIFAFSLRKLLPIPGLFEPIDYCAHELTLGVLSARLKDISGRQLPDVRPSSEAERAFLAALQSYALALQDTIDRLAHISANLCRKSKGESGYIYDSYNADVRAYKASVQSYAGLGANLNALYAAIYGAA